MGSCDYLTHVSIYRISRSILVTDFQNVSIFRFLVGPEGPIAINRQKWLFFRQDPPIEYRAHLP